MDCCGGFDTNNKMSSWKSVVCSFFYSVSVFVWFGLLNVVKCGGQLDISCPWPAFNCRVNSDVKSFALTRELRATADLLPRECSNLEWTCSNRQCIAASSRCNGISECTDGSDEFNCQGVGLGHERGKTASFNSLNSLEMQFNKNMDNCTAHISPAHEKFCRRRYRGYYRHPFNCEKYIVCEWGTYYECQCPVLTRWDMRIVACIWKYMSPCSSRDLPMNGVGSATHPSKIARLIELLTQAQSEFERKRKQKMTVQAGLLSPAIREVSQSLPDRSGIPVNTRNRVMVRGDPRYNRGRNFGLIG